MLVFGQPWAVLVHLRKHLLELEQQEDGQMIQVIKMASGWWMTAWTRTAHAEKGMT